MKEEDYTHYFSLNSGIDNTKKYAVLFNLQLICRRVILTLVILGVESKPWLQIILFELMSMGANVYMAEVRPFEDSAQDKIELINEFMITLLGSASMTLMG